MIARSACPQCSDGVRAASASPRVCVPKVCVPRVCARCACLKRVPRVPRVHPGFGPPPVLTPLAVGKAVCWGDLGRCVDARPKHQVVRTWSESAQFLAEDMEWLSEWSAQRAGGLGRCRGPEDAGGPAQGAGAERAGAEGASAQGAAGVVGWRRERRRWPAEWMCAEARRRGRCPPEPCARDPQRSLKQRSLVMYGAEGCAAPRLTPPQLRCRASATPGTAITPHGNSTRSAGRWAMVGWRTGRRRGMASREGSQETPATSGRDWSRPDMWGRRRCALWRIPACGSRRAPRPFLCRLPTVTSCAALLHRRRSSAQTPCAYQPATQRHRPTP